MPNLAVVDMEGKNVGTIELAESVFGIEPNAAVMHQMVVNYLAAQRQGTQSALTRSEVSGGGKKPWRQKGTGRARQGSTRAPQWTHGAMKSAFSSKVMENELIVVDSISMDEYKTKKIVAMLSAIGAEKKALIVLPEVDSKVIKSANNIPGVKTAQVNTLNVYDILNADKLIIVKDAVSKIEEVYA